MTPDLALDFTAGRLSQTCPACGITEAAGRYCTACLAPTGQALWRRGEMSTAQRAAYDRRRPSRWPGSAHAASAGRLDALAASLSRRGAA